MTRSATVRPAVHEDGDALWPLAHGLATSAVPERVACDRTLDAVLRSEASLLLVAGGADGLAGFLLAHALPTFFANAPVVQVEELFVVEAARRGGVGRALMAGAEEWARERGAAYACLATRRAGAFYTALGYEESAAFFKKGLGLMATGGARAAPMPA